jgi:glutamate/tyrosine decarboxylase-like PLP-dependent enzyme
MFTLTEDQQNLATILETTLQEALAVLGSLENRAVAKAPPAPTPIGLSASGLGFAATLQDFNTRFAPGFSGSAGPRYLGFVTGGTTPAALAGDWLTSVYDQNPTSSLDSSAPDLERETIGLLRQLFGLPNDFFGSFVSGATMANFVGLALGREWLAEQQGVSVAEDGLGAIPAITVLSGSAHSSSYKALSMLGIGRKALKTIAKLPQREAVDVIALEAALNAQNGVPCIVIANSGTVNTVDFDDLEAIAALRQRYPFWLHVDAAFGAFAYLSQAHRHLVAGLAQADSICIDAHKWLNVPYDSAMQFTKRRDLQVRVFGNSAAYLGLPTENPDFVHLTPENSRRLRALSTWFALQSYGSAGHCEIVEKNCALAQLLGQKIASNGRFELLAPVRMNVVCFAPTNGNQASVTALIERLRDDGQVFLTPTLLFGRPGIRAAFSNWRTTAADVEVIWQALVSAIA